MPSVTRAPLWLRTISSADHFQHHGEGIPLLLLDTPLCNALISLQGAQLLSFKPKGQPEMLWLSSRNDYQAGQRIWGGIPICAPWFGRHPTPAMPIHGFVQERLWHLKQQNENGLGEVTLVLAYDSDSQDRLLFEQAFHLELTLTLGAELKMYLKATNLDNKPMNFSWAFHNFLAVDNLTKSEVRGLGGQTYLDATRGMSQHQQSASVIFESEIDRVFQDSPDQLHLNNPIPLSIDASNSPTSIIWNPGDTLAQQMAELGDQEHRDFVCIERGAAFSDRWSLLPEKSQQGSQRLYYPRKEQ